MSTLHWFILIPYYFFGAMLLAIALTIASRLLRLQVTMERIAAIAVFSSIGGIIVLFLLGIVAIDHFTMLPVIGMIAGSLVLATIDALLQESRSLTCEIDPWRRNTSDPQVL